MMSEERSRREGSGRWQFGLLGWICWIVGAGVALGMARRARGVWDGPGRINPDVLLCLGMVAVAVWLVIALILQVGRLARGSGREGPAIAWRLGAVGLLLGLLAEAARLLAIEPDRRWGIAPFGRGEPVRLVSVATALLAMGLVLGLSPTRPASGPRPRLWWLSVVWAGLAGLVIGALYLAPIVYLVLLAIDGVFNAMHHRRALDSLLWSRLFRATPAVALAASACLATALVAARDRFRDEGESRSWGWFVPRLALLGATVASGAWLLAVTVPMIHPCLAVGVRVAIGGSGLWMLVLGFGGLAAGLAARAVAPASIESVAITAAGRRDRRVLGIALGAGLLGLLGLSVVAFLVPEPVPVTRVENAWQAVRNWSADNLPRLEFAWPLLQPETLAWELAVVWLMVRVAGLLSVGASDRAAPLDRIAAEPGSAVRFAWLGTAWAVVALAALPTLALGSLIAFHFLLTGGRANFDRPIPVPPARSRAG